MVLTSEFNSCNGALSIEPRGFPAIPGCARGGSPVAPAVGVVPGKPPVAPGVPGCPPPSPSNCSTFGAPSHSCV